MGTLGRRARTLPALFGAAALTLVTAPALLLVAALVELLRPRRGIAPRLTAFVIAQLTLESIGVFGAFLIWLFPQRGEPYLERNYALQRWWSGAVFRAASVCLSLRLSVHGAEALEGGPFVLLMRHASLIDTLLPAVLVANPGKRRLRYVLKKELLADPCLDVVGNRIPNHFVDRAQATEEDLAAIGALAKGLGPRDGVMLYPEGTFFTEARRERELARLEENGSVHLSSARALTRTLPPRVGGLSAILDAAPELDVVVCTHRGLGGSARMGDIARGALVGETIHARFWRVPAREIPKDREARLAWLYAQWAEVDRFALGEEAGSVPAAVPAGALPDRT